jgi:cysteine desulfurase
LTNTSCFSIPGIRATDIVEALVAYGIIVGTGSACSAGATEPPHTLLRMGVDYDLAAAALRVSFSRDNRSGAVDALLDAITKCVHCEPERECASAFGQFC